LDWASILPLNGSKQDGFEELCTQLARSSCPREFEFVRKGRPDSGVEAFAIHTDGGEWAWQAKYFPAMKSSQWGQLDESVKTALVGHPNLTRFIVCVPLDLADGRTGNAISARQRWNERVARWSRWAAERGMSVEFVWHGSHELLNQLAMPEHEGRRHFFFGTRYIDQSWFSARLSEALEAAGPRYTPELNVELEINENFEALGRTSVFFDDIRSEARRVRDRIRSHAFSLTKHPDATLSSKIDEARGACEAALEQFKGLSDDPVRPDPLGTLWDALREATRKVSDLLSEYLQQQDIAKVEREASGIGAGARQESDHSYMLRELYADLSAAFSRVNRWRSTVTSNLAILTGNAGTGKTHLLCDLARQRLGKGRPTIVLMGQRFLNATDPWTQALQQLDLGRWTAADFVKALEVVAQRANCRAFFVIDAINEGAGRQIWPTHLLPFLDRIKASPWISVIVSVRSSYADDLLPEEGFDDCIELEHHGFENVEFDATSAFFEHYGIELPSSPLLAPEFSNPLYLKTLCQGLQASGQTRLTKGFHGVVGAFAQYVSGINKKAAKDLDYDARRNHVSAALKDVAKHMVDTCRPWLSYDDAERIVNAHLPGRDYSRSLMATLFREGLLIEERAWSETERGFVTAVQIGYERLSDYLCVESLLDSHLTGLDPSSAFMEGGPLDHGALCATWPRPGFHEALHILVAERTGTELLDLIPTLAEEHFTPSVFLDSIVWREPEAVTPRTVDLLRSLVVSNTGDVIETLVTLATVPDHPLNAIFTNRMLRESGMADRDAWWTVGLHGLWGQQSAVDRLIQWAGRLWPHTPITDKTAELAACSIAWLLTSSNRYLRDHATKALVRVLTWRPAAIVKLIDEFADLDDAYVAERVVAAAYGATMRTMDAVGVSSVADRIYGKVFASGKPRPHLLLRDYARGIICRARYLQQDSAPTRWPKSDPPYASEWPSIPTESEIDLLMPERSSSMAQSVSWGQRRIRSSVMLDDFGRYVIGTNSWKTNWLSLRLDEPMWMSLELRTERAVAMLTQDERAGWELFQSTAEQVSRERLGLHWDKLATSAGESEDAAPRSPTKSEQLLNEIRLLLLNYMCKEKVTVFAPLMDEIASDSPSRLPPKFDLKLVQHYVVGRVFDLGWTPERFEHFDRHLTERGREANKPERIGKKYQWIAYHEMLAYMADHYQYVVGRTSDQIASAYQGSWQDDVRDLDPSNVMLRTAHDEDGAVSSRAFWAATGVTNWHSGLAPIPWAEITDDIPRLKELLFSRDAPSHSEWVSLHLSTKWTLPRPAYEDSFREGRREIWMHADGALVRRKDVGKLKLSEITRHGVQGSGLHEIFLGEVGWSEASKFFDDPYYSHLGWAGYMDPEEVKVIAATQGYARERSGFDCSVVSETIALRLPTEKLLEMLKVEWSGVSATYIDKTGAVVAFDPSANVAGPSAFLVRKECLQEMLQVHEMAVCWVVQGEKTDAAGSPDYRVHARRPFHGLFVWDGKTMAGRYSFEEVECFDEDD
jgi:hypothetical protein